MGWRIDLGETVPTATEGRSGVKRKKLRGGDDDLDK